LWVIAHFLSFFLGGQLVAGHFLTGLEYKGIKVRLCVPHQTAKFCKNRADAAVSPIRECALVYAEQQSHFLWG